MTTRDEYFAYCASIGTDPYAEQTALLSVGREFLPPCAIAAMNDDSDEDPGEEFWSWCQAQTEAAQSGHDAEIAAGYEWSADPTDE